MTEAKLEEAIEGSTLEDIAHLSAVCDASTDEIKRSLKSLKLQGNQSNKCKIVVTGEINDGFKVVLTSKKKSSNSKNEFKKVWSEGTYLYDNGDWKSVHERNAEMLKLLDERKKERIPILCEAAAELRESFANKTNNEVALKSESAGKFFEEKKPKIEAETSTKTTAKNKGIAGMFSKQSAKTKEVKSEPVEEKETKKATASPKTEEKASVFTKVKPKSKQETPRKSDEENSPVKTKLQSKEKAQKRVIEDESDDEPAEEVVQQKRKKRLVKIESDSDDEVDVKPGKKTQKTAKDKGQGKLNLQETANPKEKQPKAKDGRRRVLKEVTKTFKDEEGYLVTKIVKEMVSETDSEDESDAAKKTLKSSPPTSTKKPVAAPKGQASIFSFFKKK